MTIMVVEDEELLLKAIVKKLEVMGIKALSCSGGKQGIDYLSNMSELPDAIWLDYYLKDMNGLEFAGVLKNNPAWEKIPVVVVSNSASTEKVQGMLALGVEKYLLKAEYRLDDIIGIIKDMINKSGKEQS